MGARLANVSRWVLREHYACHVRNVACRLISYMRIQRHPLLMPCALAQWPIECARLLTLTRRLFLPIATPLKKWRVGCICSCSLVFGCFFCFCICKYMHKKESRKGLRLIFTHSKLLPSPRRDAVGAPVPLALLEFERGVLR